MPSPCNKLFGQENENVYNSVCFFSFFFFSNTNKDEYNLKTTL